jgi:hypothetical protein
MDSGRIAAQWQRRYTRCVKRVKTRAKRGKTPAVAENRSLCHLRFWGVVRRNRQLSRHKLQRLRRRRIHGGRLEDWLVRAGTGVFAPRQLLRYVRWRRGGTRYELLTNVLAPARFSAEEALDLYPYRWSVERMFFDLKEVLNLNRLYAANPNAVAGLRRRDRLQRPAGGAERRRGAGRVGARAALAREVLPEGRHGHLSRSASATVGT